MKNHTLMLLPVILLAGCSPKQKPNIITTSFVSFDVVHNIVGDTLLVSNVVPWGSEVHSFEPLARDIININEAELFVYSTPLLETWVKDLVQNENAFDMSAHYTHDDDHNDHEEHDHSSLHFWTNPISYVEVMDDLLTTLNHIYPQYAAQFSQNHKNYTNSIKNTIVDLNTFLSDVETPLIYFAGHNALDAFSEEFGLTIRSLSDTYKPDIDFSAKDIEAVILEMIDNDVHYLFVEELAEPRAAEVIKNEFKRRNHTIEIRELHGYHNITSSEAKEDVTYDELFKRNVTYIKEALSH